MKNTDGDIQYMEDWFGFYKSIDTRNNNNKWLIDFALEYYKHKLSKWYNTKNNHKIDNSDYDLPTIDIIPSTYYSTNNTPSNQQI